MAKVTKGTVGTTTTVDFREDVVLMSLTFHAPGCRRKMKATDLDDEADEKMIHVSKDLVDSQEYREVRQAENRFKGWLLTRAIDCAVFRKGVYPLPIRVLDEVDTAIKDFIRLYDEKLVPAFLDVLPQKMEEAKKRLGKHFNAADYPSVAQLRRAFWVEYSYVMLGAPDKLKSVSAAVWQREAEKIEKMWQEAGTSVRNALRAGFADLVQRMVKRCTEAEDGKRRVIKEAGVERLTDFLDTFERRNVTSDVELKALVAQAKAAMRGVEVSGLRDDETMRARVGDAFKQLATTVQGWEQLKPSRKLRLDD